MGEQRKLRVYYSELATDVDFRSRKVGFDLPRKNAYLWEVMTERNAPIFREFAMKKRPRYLAPAERWMCYDEEKSISFPVDVFKPKVQLQHLVEPFKIPRNVQIERKMRQYQQQDINECLAELKIEFKEILPVELIRKEWRGNKFGLYKMIHWLPLEWFDNEEFCSRTPEGWLDHGLMEGIRHPIPAQAFLPALEPLRSATHMFEERLNSLHKWTNVAVLDYDYKKEKYKLLTLDGRQRTYYLPELYILFKAEEPMKCAKRIGAALDLRNKVENIIRHEFYLDCMLLKGTYEIPTEVMVKLEKLLGKIRLDLLEKHEALIAEIQLNHKRTLGQLQFRYAVGKEPENYRFITLPEQEVETVREKGRVDTGIINFAEKRDYFRWYSIYVLPNSLHAMSQVVLECLKVQQMTLWTLNYGKLVTLEEFETAQNKYQSHIMKFLKYSWIDATAFNLRMCIGDVGKGWFNINETKHEIYNIAKLLRLFECVKYRMQYALRVMVENSVKLFTNLIETPCQTCLQVEPDFVWGMDYLNSPFVPRTAAIFNMQLKLSENAAYYSTDTEQFEKILLKMYDGGVIGTHSIKQVHPCLLQHLKFPNDLYLSSVGLLDECVTTQRERFVQGYRKAVIPLKAYALEYHIFLELSNMNVPQFIQQYKDAQHSAVEVKEEVLYHLRMKDKLEETVPNVIVIGPFSVSIDSLKQFLISKRLDIAKKLLDQFAERMKVVILELIGEYQAILSKLQERAQSIEQIYDVKDWMETVPMTVKTLEETAKRLLLEYEILDVFWYNLTQEDFDNKWLTIGLPFEIVKQVDLTNDFLIEDTDKFLKLQLAEEAALQERIEALTVQIANMYALKDPNKCHEIAIEMKRAWKAMKEAQEQGYLLNTRQKLFLLPVVPFDMLNKLIKEFEPYKNLWVTASDWLQSIEIWMDNPLSNVDAEAMERNVTEMYKTMIKCIKTFGDYPGIQQVAIDVRDQIEIFRPKMPIMHAIRNPGMKQRHYDEFNEKTGLSIPFGPAVTFKQCLDLGIESAATDFGKISECAEKEFAIEATLDKMQEEWEHINLDLTAYKNTGTYIMKVSDDVQQMLDDHIVLTQQISFSPFKAAMSERIDEWEEQLKVTAEVVDEWVEVQKAWMYLEPIFTSPDISKQLPHEAKKYGTMERSWKRIMRSAYEKPKMIPFCGDRKLLESLKDANHILEVVQKGLSDYLEMKRSIFPRLFFLSDDELLEILSQARNPLAVQPHLRKCFENIARLNFEHDLQITQMFSAEEECVNLNPTLYPTGSVENWLVIVESSMKNTVRTIFGDAYIDIYLKDRKKWVLSWPGQVVIAASQTYWTAGVENAILTDTLKEFFDVLLANLDALRTLVKGQMTFLQREIVSALIVIEVHSRDVSQKLVDIHVRNVNDFEWISQLRYYWVKETDVKVRAVNAEFQYGYEYLGNSGRLVITPLTDRCYLTLTGALHLKFGGAPAGPAGTGKTETTKDLAKAMAIQCVVFNCSDQLDFMAMGKFFKGLASSGAWACFDEFNRIDIEVLSVVAQQIMTIQKAQQSRQERLMFEGSDIALKDSCAVFITMNPGYAGRTELPDNLKALFRPVAMMVPNYSLIAEISLFSFGFGNASQLANKITTTFKLSSEQLSSQDHYDFGMRAVKTVIAVAGNLKREKPNMDERQIVLRALQDVNVPKFLKDDLKLFNGIVSDLFPRMVEETVDYGALEESIRATCIKKGLEDVNDYVIKVIQLYETTVVRHGLMLVGPTGSGKTKCYQVLKSAMTALQGKPSPSGYPFQKVNTYVLNPKSITMGQLYGEFDLQTHEWTDGILPSLVRIGVAAENKEKCWYVFDGPVDAVWIENMNTVLDDNKKLCLSSGEIIKLRDTQTMMFEVADLAVASPATVSRCGMVYLEPSVLGLPPFLNCWIKTLPPLAAEFGDKLQELFKIYLLPAIELLREHLREILTSVDSALVQTFLRNLDFRLGPLRGRDNKPPPPSQFLANMPDLIVPWVVFSLIWSIGCTCDNDGRMIFSDWLRETMKLNKHTKAAFPIEGLVYDYRLHDGGFTDPTEDGEPKKPRWINWMANVEEYVINTEMKYSDIEVPTIDNQRNAELIGMILINERNVLCVGPTGTGKTLTVIAKLGKNMHKKFICDFINFSARTSANQTQDLIDGKLDRRRRGVFGPPVLKRQVFFIDDFNMPALEVYGAQPPIELIRQWMDFSGWYDRRSIGDFRTIIDVNFVAAMGPPGGGRNPVTARCLRHFHFLGFLEMEDTSKREIFGKILSFWLGRTEGCSGFYNIMLNASLDVYKTILRELLPTPAKTHYTFNLRDLSKVFQGVLMFEAEIVNNIETIIRLWYHENCRVFQDRLVNDEDRQWFDGLLRNKIKGFKYDPEACVGRQKLFYADFLDPTSDVRLYTQVLDVDQMSRVLINHLEEYNAHTTRPMKLVLFLDAMDHICRITRIIRQPMGNALLLGMGGSGRQSLTRLAAHIEEFFCFQIELTKAYSNTDWKEDVKQLMLKAGLYDRETVFLFSDTQIKSESFLEDLNNMLNSGDIPNVYQPDEFDQIYQNMKGIVTAMGMTATKSNLFSVYQRRVRSNLHTCITMSPIGEIFRARLRQFPALVNCCTIDWFSAWPDSALQSVAYQYLADIAETVSDHILNGIVIVCQFMHASVLEASTRFLQELSRHNYVTPTSYLQLLNSYTDLMTKRKSGLVQGIGRLKTGLEKLQTTADEVKILQVDLESMKPALEVAAKEAEIMIVQIAADTEIAEATRMIVEKEEEVAIRKALETQAIAEDAERDLEAAMPALQAAEKSLQSLNKNDINEVKAMKRPPAGVIYVIEAICIVKGIKPLKRPGNLPGEKVNDYWEPGRAMLSDAGLFLNSLMNFDRDSITEGMIAQLQHYVDDPAFQPAKIIKVSKACTSLCMWVHAMYKYYFVNLTVAPKKATLAQAKADLAETEALLAVAQGKLAEVMAGLNILNERLAQRIAFKEEKEASINLCQERMNRAVRLITGLADERVRWITTIANIEKNTVNVTGDILICSGAVAYLTPFTDSYRKRLFEDWMVLLEKVEVPHSIKCDPMTILGEPVEIRQWQIDGLPRDALSTENAVLVSCSRRWPLFIDPQGQANKWIKNMGKRKGLAIVKLADKDLIRTLELAIRFGKPVLIENVGTELDPALDPVLLRALFKQGSIWMLKLGESLIPYNDDFQLYITTKLPNPHYTPEISIKVQLVNFTVVSSGLQDQLLGLVVLQERPDLEEQRSQIVISSAQMKQELKEIEDRILYKLSTSEGSPVDDIDFIITLESSKVKSEDIKSKVEAAEITQIDIDNTRAQYIPVANRGQILFFCVSDLSNVDPMYQYSLEWFITIFIRSMAETEKTENLEERVQIINDDVTFSLYSNVCRSLFGKDKLLFAFLLCVRILMDMKKISPQEWHHFLAGASPASQLENPAPSWISEKAWKEILALDHLPSFKKYVNTFAQNIEKYKNIFESPQPHRVSLPGKLNVEFDDFQKLIILKTLRPDKVTIGMQDYLAKHMGQRFIEPQTTDLSQVFKESGPLIPLIFVLSTGTDPAADLYKFADKMKMSKRMYSISLGQGQGPRAEKMIHEAVEVGSWVFFQNCHLAPSWMPSLEHLIETISPETAHKDFRIWLTSTPSPHFPVAILQNSSKMTVEPPRGLKANMLRAYMSQVSELSDFFHSEHPKVFTFKWLLFSLCIFHGCLLERRKFGPLGFNIPYEFTDGDLKICISQLYMFLMEYSEVPFKVLVYTAGHINYGGRVTDDWDRRCLMSILSDYYRQDVISPDYLFDDAGIYHQLPGESTLLEFLDYIKTFPLNDIPALFGLHANADISCAQATTSSTLATLLLLQPKQIGGTATSQEDQTSNMAKSILGNVPDIFDVDYILELYPVLYSESLNTVIVQEAIRYNKLLKVITTSLKDLLKALKGLVVMSEALEKMSLSLFSNMVPAMWASKAYPSLKPLGAWVTDLNARTKFLQKWVREGIPPAFWISGFYFPQAFLTGTLQNYARKFIISIDTIGFDFQVLDGPPAARPKDGCVIYGLFLEGCRWNKAAHILEESAPKELYTEYPPIWLIPEEFHKKPEDGVYLCPVYKTLTRAGVLSTTGHSTNYVLAIEVPTNENEHHWIRRGVALFCALDY